MKVVIILALVVNIVHAADQCNPYAPISVEQCLEGEEQSPTSPTGQCQILKNDTVCQKTFNITTIQDHFFKYYIEGLLQSTLKQCCGDCVKTRLLHNYGYMDEFGQNLQSQNVTMANFIFPIVGSSSKKYGKYFLPIFHLRGAEFFTEKLQTKDTINALLTACLNLWPLILITLLMAFVAGFVEWLLDTRKNEDEFPREFVPGVFQGFWWSFVSMTTVGYGDKSPRSVTARLFAVAWIVIGITICSMLTASLTNAITAASTPPTPTISGKTVGILNEQLFDLVLVIQEEGKPKGYDTIEELKAGFNADEIEGFLLNSFTAQGYVKALTNYRKTPITYSGKQMSYGVLINNYEDYFYLKGLFEDNGILLQSCTTAALGRAQHNEEAVNIFSPKAGLFTPTIVVLFVMIILIFIFGIFYELRRRKKVKEESAGIEESEFKAMDSNVLRELEKILEILKEKKSVTYENMHVEKDVVTNQKQRDPII